MLDLISADHTVIFLNRALELDREAISKLVASLVQCNQALADHETIQAWSNPPRVGMLGILNGLFGVDDRGWGPICAVVGDDGLIQSFERTPVESKRIGK